MKDTIYSLEKIDLLRIFSAAFCDNKLDDDGDFYVHGGLEIPVWIFLNPEVKAIKLYTFVNMKVELTLEEVNDANISTRVPCFTFDKDSPNTLIAEYYLTMEDGLTEEYIVRSTRRFASAVLFASRELAGRQ
jgi:hypothetical protein